MKEKYVKPVVSVVEFENDDIITASGGVCEEDEMNKLDKKTGQLITVAYGNDGIWNFF